MDHMTSPFRNPQAIRAAGKMLYDAIVDACCTAWNSLMRMPEQIASITIHAWAQVKV
jgi:hypothetical protein